MKHVPQGMTNFFRAFYYMKGGEFPGNQNLTPLRPMATTPTRASAAELIAGERGAPMATAPPLAGRRAIAARPGARSP